MAVSSLGLSKEDPVTTVFKDDPYGPSQPLPIFTRATGPQHPPPRSPSDPWVVIDRWNPRVLEPDIAQTYVLSLALPLPRLAPARSLHASEQLLLPPPRQALRVENRSRHCLVWGQTHNPVRILGLTTDPFTKANASSPDEERSQRDLDERTEWTKRKVWYKRKMKGHSVQASR